MIEQDAVAETVRLREEVEQLRHALAHRPETDRVVGMLMLASSCTADVGWAMLSRVSQTTNRKAREVSALISAHVGTGAALPADLTSALRDVLPPSSTSGRVL